MSTVLVYVSVSFYRDRPGKRDGRDHISVGVILVLTVSKKLIDLMSIRFHCCAVFFDLSIKIGKYVMAKNAVKLNAWSRANGKVGGMFELRIYPVN